jgi:CNT family concentrative nucleoside transporter
MTELKFISLLGWFTMIAVAWAISYNRRLFPWRTVVWGVGLQFTLALLILKTPWGAEFFVFAGKVVQKLIQFSNEGCKFVFGPLADSDLLTEKFGPGNSVISPSSSRAPSSLSRAFRRCSITGAFCRKSSRPPRG